MWFQELTLRLACSICSFIELLCKLLEKCFCLLIFVFFHLFLKVWWQPRDRRAASWWRGWRCIFWVFVFIFWVFSCSMFLYSDSGGQILRSAHKSIWEKNVQLTKNNIKIQTWWVYNFWVREMMSVLNSLQVVVFFLTDKWVSRDEEEKEEVKCDWMQPGEARFQPEMMVMNWWSGIKPTWLLQCWCVTSCCSPGCSSLPQFTATAGDPVQVRRCGHKTPLVSASQPV